MGKVSELLLENEALKGELSAAREQLAEARLFIQEVVDCPIGARIKHHRKAEQWLSAAPAGGRVLAEGIVGWIEDDDGFGTPALLIPRSLRRSLGFALAHYDLDEVDHKPVVLVIREAPPKEPEDDDWPKECPRCGAAGGSELGPCPMCKGAGFVDEE